MNESDGEGEVQVRFPPGHYYSPLPDTRRLSRADERARIWPPTPRPAPGIDWREADQLVLCAEFARQEEMAFPLERTGNPLDYTAASKSFSLVDALVLQAMLQRLRPQRMIEVGAGHSSIVTARVNRELLEGGLHFTCIDPYPRNWLRRGAPGITDLRIEEIQHTPLEIFGELGANDILFIDSSHTVKTGGDVPWLFQEVIPRLNPGVAVHVHDAFLPGDYPAQWVLEGRGWNETYLLHAFLSFNSEFRIMLGVQYLAHFHPQAIVDAFDQVQEFTIHDGGSLWLRRAAPSEREDGSQAAIS